MPPLPGYDEALERVLEHMVRVRTREVALHEALGKVLREDVLADRDQPPFDRSAMDGFAVRSSEIARGVQLKIDGSMPAGGDRASFETPVPAGCARRIATGAPLPAACDAMLPMEVASVSSDGASVSFAVDGCRPWQNIHRRGADKGKGEPALVANRVIEPQHVGIAAAIGHVKLKVSDSLRITVLTTGDEVVPPETSIQALQPQQIRNSNGPMLLGLLRCLLPGADARVEHVHVPDEPEQTRTAAREAIARSHLVLTTGGVSVGERDYLPWAWKQLGLDVVLQGVAIQPGKPVFVARDEGKMVIGLPGNPVSVLCTAHLFVWPVVRMMMCVAPSATKFLWRDVVLGAETKASSKRQVFRAASIAPDGRSAWVLPWQGSGDLMHTYSADAWVRLPLQDEVIPAGTVVKMLPMIGVSRL